MSLRELFKRWTYAVFAPGVVVRSKYEAFRNLLEHDRRALELITELERLRLAPDHQVDWARVEMLCRDLNLAVSSEVHSLAGMNPAAYPDLEERLKKIAFYLDLASSLSDPDFSPPYTLDLDQAAGRFDLCGGKAAHLAEVRILAGLPTPEGFVITTNASRYLLEYNGLRERHQELLAGIDLEEPATLAKGATALSTLILEAETPPAVLAEMTAALGRLQETAGSDALLAVRSSARGEDATPRPGGQSCQSASFAGQYHTELRIRPSDLDLAYRSVLAGKFSPEALAYRIRYGLADAETPMAVLVLPMVDAAWSGVVYSRDPGPAVAGAGFLSIYSVSGTGEHLVDGSMTPEVVSYRRESRSEGQDAGRIRLAGRCDGEVCRLDGTASEGLDATDADRLAGLALRLEEFYGQPQDVEWCLDRQGSPFILQSRPVQTIGEGTGTSPSLEASGEVPAGIPVDAAPPNNPVLLRSGTQASPGAAAGTVFVLRSLNRLEEVPQDTVLVTPTLSPALTQILGRIRAVVAETGSRASHFASVAREFGIPVLVGAVGATGTLPEGRLVTVDADGRTVYDGRAETLLAHGTPGPVLHTPFRERLERIIALVSPLNLTDPDSTDFRPSAIRTVHDLVRFCHEKSVAEMFSLAGSDRGLGSARKLDSGLPLTMRVLDLGGGLVPGTGGAPILTPDMFAEGPMRAVWRGLIHSSVAWSGGTLHFDWSAFSDMTGGGGIIAPASASLSSYAIVADGYLHLMVRFGYHFAVMDSLAGGRAEANYVKFRFKGGGGDPEGRLRRIALIAEVLESAGFETRTRGDMLDAGLQRREADYTLKAVELLGVILGRTRLLDMAIADGQNEPILRREFADLLMELDLTRE